MAAASPLVERGRGSTAAAAAAAATDARKEAQDPGVMIAGKTAAVRPAAESPMMSRPPAYPPPSTPSGAAMEPSQKRRTSAAGAGAAGVGPSFPRTPQSPFTPSSLISPTLRTDRNRAPALISNSSASKPVPSSRPTPSSSLSGIGLGDHVPSAIFPTDLDLDVFAVDDIHERRQVFLAPPILHPPTPQKPHCKTNSDQERLPSNHPQTFHPSISIRP